MVDKKILARAAAHAVTYGFHHIVIVPGCVLLLGVVCLTPGKIYNDIKQDLNINNSFPLDISGSNSLSAQVVPIKPDLAFDEVAINKNESISETQISDIAKSLPDSPAVKQTERDISDSGEAYLPVSHPMRSKLSGKQGTAEGGTYKITPDGEKDINAVFTQLWISLATLSFILGRFVVMLRKSCHET